VQYSDLNRPSSTLAGCMWIHWRVIKQRVNFVLPIPLPTGGT
jgi:hypothetical protein